MFSPQTNMAKQKKTKKPGLSGTLPSTVKSTGQKKKDHQNPVGPWGLKTEPRYSLYIHNTFIIVYIANRFKTKLHSIISSNTINRKYTLITNNNNYYVML